MIFRRGLGVVSLGDDGPFYAVGGLDETCTYDTVERYDPTSDTWTTVSAMITKRGGMALAVHAVS